MVEELMNETNKILGMPCSVVNYSVNTLNQSGNVKHRKLRVTPMLFIHGVTLLLKYWSTTCSIYRQAEMGTQSLNGSNEEIRENTTTCRYVIYYFVPHEFVDHSDRILNVRNEGLSKMRPEELNRQLVSDNQQL